MTACNRGNLSSIHVTLRQSISRVPQVRFDQLPALQLHRKGKPRSTHETITSNKVSEKKNRSLEVCAIMVVLYDD
jgi:hypothetical protein